MSDERFWIGLGLLAEALFGARVLVQWLASERLRRSVVPPMYWYLSLAGGVMLLTYAVYRLDPIFIVGEAFGVLVFARNVVLIRRTRG
jgi:lipid-A-disaccharide synthase-like uncharacterized protein